DGADPRRAGLPELAVRLPLRPRAPELRDRPAASPRELGRHPGPSLTAHVPAPRRSTMSTTPPPSPAAPAAPPAAEHPRPTGRWRRVGVVVALALAAVAAVPAAQWVGYRRGHSQTEDAFVEAHIVNVAPESVSGRIVRFTADENDRVEAGQ